MFRILLVSVNLNIIDFGTQLVVAKQHDGSDHNIVIRTSQ